MAEKTDPTLIVTSVGSARRKSGDSFDPMLNVNCRGKDVTKEQFGFLFDASKTERIVAINGGENLRCKVSKVDGKHEEVKTTLVFIKPTSEQRDAIWDLMANEDEVTLAAAQRAFGDGQS